MDEDILLDNKIHSNIISDNNNNENITNHPEKLTDKNQNIDFMDRIKQKNYSNVNLKPEK